MEKADPNNGDELVFAQEETGKTGPQHATRRTPWRVLIVDDDQDVHEATLLALRNTPILGRALAFLHAYSATQAREMLERDGQDVAVILLDVVMEQEDAGLKLVRAIREDLGLRAVRIVLRTGQPGYAPEIDAIRDYEINDYKTKSELTRNRLYTTLTAAIRSYDQIRTIEASRRGLDLIVQASSELMALHGMRAFAAGVITQIAALLGLQADGVVCAQEDSADPGQFVVIAAAGRHAEMINRPLAEIDDAVIRAALDLSLRGRNNIYETKGSALFFPGRPNRDVAAWVENASGLDELDRRLLEVFCQNIAVGFQNAALFARLHAAAYYDPLSRLPNRNHFITQIERMLGGSERDSHLLALLDIDHFAETNDALGHGFGDKLLLAIAHRLRASLTDDVSVARVAGDTFGLLGPAGHLAPSNLSGLFQEPFVIDGQEMAVSVTMGLLNFAETGHSGQEAYANANTALKAAKARNRGEVSYFTRDMSIEIQERVMLHKALRQAFDNDRLFLVYQPQVALETGAVVGAEALIRWRGEDGKFIPPDRFVPLAERTNLIVAIGEWVLRVACHQQARLAREGFGRLRIAVNVSAVQFAHARFPFQLRRAIEDSGADPSRIELEITESVAMEEPGFLVQTIGKLKELGVSIAIDDFGTGFSSLSYLRRLAVDRLKIDRAFVNEITDSARGAQIPKWVIQLGQELGLIIVAEGVEDAEQAMRLRELGCHEAQGYYFARPMEAGSLSEWLIKH